MATPEQEEAPEAAAAAEKEEGECGLCLFMEAEGCKDAFVAWEECVAAAAAQEEDGTDVVNRCHEVISNLNKCMSANADYYAPLLRAQQAFNQRAEAEAAAAAIGQPAASPQQADSVTGEGKKKEETGAEESLSN